MTERRIRWLGTAALALCFPAATLGQLDLGMLQGSAVNERGEPAEVVLEIEGAIGWKLTVRSDARGQFTAMLPYGWYTVRAAPLGAACRVRVLPLEISRCRLRPGENTTAGAAPNAAAWAYSAAQDLMFRAPAVTAYPLDFGATGSIRLPLLSWRAASWTATGFRLNGLDASDSYQPGEPAILDDLAAEYAVVDGNDAALFLRGSDNSWHSGLATDDTGSILAGDNLPPRPGRGIVRRPEEFRWFTRDTVDVGGALNKWSDISATATGQWSSQTAPQWPDGTPVGSRMLFANARGRVRLGPRDQLDALYSGSRLDLSNGGWPAGIEAVLASPVMPSFYGIEGFENLRETDHFDLVQAGWTHQLNSGALELRYGYSTAHLDTASLNGPESPSRIDLLDPAPEDSPLSNFAVRTRHQFGAAWQRGGLGFGAAWEESSPRNRFQAPAGTDLISAGGEPAFLVRLNVPADTRARIDSFYSYARDAIRLLHGITLDLAVALDTSRGLVANRPAAISWTSVSPRAGIVIPVPGLPRLVLRGSYARTHAPLAGRYLDFADPGALSGLVYDAPSGRLLDRFGGAYSTVAGGLKRPYADAFDVSAELSLPLRSTFAVDLSRRDDKDRLAAVDIGAPAGAYRPLAILDPGPDSIPGTFDDQNLAVYARDPSALGRDAYLLTNPADLRELSEAITAAVSTHYRYLDTRASFTAEKSFGPTNPANSISQNDPGIVGALFSDPNTLLNATGHAYMDRAFLGKFEAGLAAPPAWGGLRFENTVNYLDGLPFARQLLVTGLPQGPFLVNATLRGSPEGGNRAEYVLNWNLRIEREFEMPFGRLDLIADLLNVLNNGNKIIESDLSGPLFNQRPALAIPPPRTLRLGLRWRF